MAAPVHPDVVTAGTGAQVADLGLDVDAAHAEQRPHAPAVAHRGVDLSTGPVGHLVVQCPHADPERRVTVGVGKEREHLRRSRADETGVRSMEGLAQVDHLYMASIAPE